MPDLLATAATWLAGQQTSHLSQTVTYDRDGDTVSLAATKCPQTREVDAEFGRLEVVNQDWLIDKSLIVLDGETVLPRKNDVIEEADGTRWQVLPTSAEKEYRELAGGKLRIHTKQIEDA